MIVLVDWSWLIYREFYANQSMSVEKSGVEIKTGSIRGSFKFLKEIHEAHPEAQVYLCLDGRPLKALALLPNYKGQRNRDNETISVSRDRIADVFVHLPFVKIAYSPYQEADDTIAFLCEMLEREEGQKLVIMSSDMDLRQLVSGESRIYTSSGFDDTGIVLEDAKQVQFKLGVPPRSIPMLKAITGDDSDNIKGVPYFNKEAAKTLSTHFTHPDALLGAKDKLLRSSFSAAAARIFDNWETVVTNFKVTQIDPEHFPEIRDTSDTDWQEFLTYYEAVTTLQEMRQLCGLA